MTRDGRGEPDLAPGPARDLVDLYRHLLRCARLTNGQVAIRAGLSPSHLSEVLHGWNRPAPPPP